MISVLKGLDSKMRINSLINDNLRQLILDIFSKWFYRFEYPNSNFMMPLESPIKLNKSIRDIIPPGWSIASLSDNPLCSFIDVGVPYFESKNYLATANVNEDSIQDGENITFENRESRANMKPAPNAVWFAKMKNIVKHIYISSKAQWMVDKYIFSTGFFGLQCTDVSFPYIASVIMQPYFELAKNTLAHGATQESVNNDDLKSVPIIVPAEKILIEYSKLAGPYFEKMNVLMQENQNLAKLRNELLPLLMNGQISLN